MLRVMLTTLNAKYVHSSLALRYLRASIEQQCDVVMREFTIHDPVEHVLTNIYAVKPDILGISCYIWNITETLRLIPLVKKVLPQTMIVLGGPEVSYDSMEFMELYNGIDVIVRGEGELTLKLIVQSFECNQPFDTIRGIVFRTEEGMIDTGVALKIPSLDEIPSPYAAMTLHELDKRIVYFEASRGCPFSCQFCLSSIEAGVRYFSLERVKDDLTRLIEYGVRQIKFVDRTFNLRKDYALAIFEHVLSLPGDTTFHFEITGDILKSEVVSWLIDHAPPGKFRFEIGVQSTNDITNAIIKRRQDFAKLAETVTRIRESGVILQHLDLIAGLPEEDYNRFAQTFNEVYALRPDELQLGFLKLLRGTGLRKCAAQYGYVYMDTAPYEMLSNDTMPYEDVVRLKRLEDILEKYYNSGRFPRSIPYLTNKCFATPFDFFQRFGDFWNLRGYERIGHQINDLFVRLEEFLREENIVNETAYALLRADFLLREKIRPKRLWWKRILSEVTLTMLRASEPPLTQGETLDASLLKRCVIDRIPAEAARELELTKEEMSDDLTVIYCYPKGLGHPTVHLLKCVNREVNRDFQWQFPS
ncbi:B12-binding domain-containing radical SAM protein [Ferroacidibacillus organovorans]|uniref:Uncharacterized protein n=1 Tax=Ferroacidibacillus organovorans TaxID=1765683 RepID=A0A101XQN4_9BACL|nr:B12-binding domain-containing radical SAM protein [Ferroacidibacillus organovorans]KUO95768.1 hypothetical protein ATW55_05415 [Ferroacidibacillus organovorans]